MIRPLLLVVAAWFLLTWAIVVGVVVGLSLASHVFASAPRPDHAALVSPAPSGPPARVEIGPSGLGHHCCTNRGSPSIRGGRASTGVGLPPRPVGTPPPRPMLVGPSIAGIASFVGPSYGPRYLALPGGRGITVRICGASACIVRVSTDAGPDRAMQRAPYGRVADLSFADFALVCDCDPWVVGLTRVSVVRS